MEWLTPDWRRLLISTKCGNGVTLNVGQAFGGGRIMVGGDTSITSKMRLVTTEGHLGAVMSQDSVASGPPMSPQYGT